MKIVELRKKYVQAQGSTRCDMKINKKRGKKKKGGGTRYWRGSIRPWDRVKWSKAECD